jgi:spore coat protein CotH
VLLVAAAVSPASAQTAADLFDPGVLHDLRLWINSRDLAALREQAATNTYYTADLEWRGLRVRSVGIRSRGSGSRNGTKLALRVDFNRYVSGQEFLGLRSLVLDNLWQDPSMLREHVAMALFAQLGQPSSRESFARLFINDEYQGVYGLVEPVDSRYLSRVLGERDGYLFEYRWLLAYYFEDLGDDLGAYATLFEAENHEHESRATAYTPIREMVRAINGASDGRWKAETGRYIDLRQFVTLAAIEEFMAEWDGLIGYAGVNNFYLYRREGTDQHLFIPWDRDNAFYDLRASVFERAGENRLLRRALADPELRRHFQSELERCARTAERDGWLETTIVRGSSLIRPAALLDPRKPYSGADHDAAVATLLEFARARPRQVLSELARGSGSATGEATAPAKWGQEDTGSPGKAR